MKSASNSTNNPALLFDEDSRFKYGDKVSYQAYEGAPLDEGIVKAPSHRSTAVFVVFHCGGDWDNFHMYTGALVPTDTLRKGWLSPVSEDEHCI